MKTLKRTLCLVLALVLALSTMAVVSAKFADENDITAKYAEAVEVMAALGILEGRTETDFVPAGTLTRAEAAKLVSFVRFGDSAADLADGSVCRFEDVADGSWASAWIEVMAEYGAICGVSDTKFAPNAKLTGYQWAKLLLCALGYGQGATVGSDEYFEGLGWEIRVKRYADMAGLLDCMAADFDLNGAIRRDEAAQMAFNAMLVKVNDTSFKTFVSDGQGGYIVVNVQDVVYDGSLGYYNYGLDKMDGVVEGKTMYLGAADTESTADLYCSLVNGSKQALTETAVNYDLCARHASAWFVKDAKGAYVQLTALKYEDTFTKVKDVAALKALKTDKDNSKAIPVFVNGALDSKAKIADLAKEDYVFDTDNNKAPVAYDYDSDGYVDALIIEKWVVAEVSASAADDKGVVTYTFTNVEYTAPECVKGGYEPEKWIVKGAAGAYADKGLYTIVPNEMFAEALVKADFSTSTSANVFLRPAVALATKTGTVSDVVKTYDPDTPSNWKNLSDITFKTSFGNVQWSAGKTYNYFISNLNNWFDLDGWYNYYDTFNFKFYMDKNGEVVAYEIVEDTEFVGFVNDFYFVYGDTTATGHYTTETAYTVYAHIVDLDGKVMSIPVSKKVQNNQIEIFYYLDTMNNVKAKKLTGIVASFTEAEALVNEWNKQLNTWGNFVRVEQFWLNNQGVYSFVPYADAKLISLDPWEVAAGKEMEGPYGCYDYNFTADTKIFNVSETAGVLKSEKMSAPVVGWAWMVLDGKGADKDGNDYTIATAFYSNYVAPTSKPVTAFIAAGTEFSTKTSNKDGVLYTFNAYIDGVKTSLTVSEDVWFNMTLDATKKGGFYTFNYDTVSGLYTGGIYVIAKAATVTDTYAANKTFDYVETNWPFNTVKKDVAMSSIKVVDVTNNEVVSPAVGDVLYTVVGLANSTVAYTYRAAK